MKFIQYLKEYKEGNIVLYHGSSTTRKIYDHFYDNQFFTVNDYIATNYAYNLGGYLYKVKVNIKNVLDLIEKQDRMSNVRGEYGVRGPYLLGSDKHIQSIVKDVYGEKGLKEMIKNGFHITAVASAAHGGKWEEASDYYPIMYKPITDYAVKNNYDAIKFMDESFDVQIKDVSYIILDGSSVEILDVYDVEENVESNYSIPPKSVMGTKNSRH